MHPNDPDDFRDPLGRANLSAAEAAAAIYAVAHALGLDSIADAASDTIREELREELRDRDDGTDAFDALMEEAEKQVACTADTALGVLKYELAKAKSREARRATHPVMASILKAHGAPEVAA